MDERLSIAATFARIGDRILSFIGVCMAILLLLYGGYSLWDNAMIYNSAFVSNDLLKFKPFMGETGDTFPQLQEINKDVYGWITIDDTHIDYPLVQGETNFEYVNKNVYGEFSFSGSIFLDSENSYDFSDNYNIVYGHHVENGAMFGDIVKFLKKDYFDKHLKGTLYLLDSTYDITIFACIEVDGYDRNVYNINQYQTGVGNLIDYVNKIATVKSDLSVNGDDKLIALSTCAEAATNGRIVLIGKLEEIELDTGGNKIYYE